MILTAVPFICYFVAILLVYIFLINLSSQILSHRISPKIYKPVNFLIIAGIIGGILMMLQPFTIVLYKISFMVVLVSLLLFIFWSHVIPGACCRKKRKNKVRHRMKAAANVRLIWKSLTRRRE